MVHAEMWSIYANDANILILGSKSTFSVNNYDNACAREFITITWVTLDRQSPRERANRSRDRYIAQLCLRALFPLSDRHFGLIALDTCRD